MPVVGGLPEGEDDDAADATPRSPATLGTEHGAAHAVLVERDRRARPRVRLAGGFPAGGGECLRPPLEEVQVEDRHAGRDRRRRHGRARLERQPGGDGPGRDEGDRRDGGHERTSFEKTVFTTFTQH
jgi:hypothetical protein